MPGLIRIRLSGIEAKAVAWHINNELDTLDGSVDIDVRSYQDGGVELSIDGETVQDLAERVKEEVIDVLAEGDACSQD